MSDNFAAGILIPLNLRTYSILQLHHPEQTAVLIYVHNTYIKVFHSIVSLIYTLKFIEYQIAVYHIAI